MRIYHLDHGAGFGGAERALLELAVSQLELGHEPIVVLGRHGRLATEAVAAGLEVDVLGWPARYVGVPQRGSLRTIAAALPDFLTAARLLRRSISGRRPDIVHVHTRKAQLATAIAVWGMRTTTVWHLHDDLPRRNIVRLAARLAIGRADHAVAVSRWMVEDYRKSGALPRSGRIGLVPSSVRMTALRDLPTPWLDGRRHPVVGYVGQIAQRKGPDLLIGAAERLADLPDVSFVIVGDVAFPMAEGRYGDELRSRIAGSAASTRLRWLPATNSPEEAFAEIDLLVVPSRAPEPFGRVIVEAMASHRPIVGVASGATLELLDASCAVLVPEATASALALGIRSVLEDVGSARRRADAAAPLAEAYEPLTIARRMEAEYAVAGP